MARKLRIRPSRAGSFFGVNSLIAILLPAICAFVPLGLAQDSTPSAPPSVPSEPRQILRRPAPEPEPEKLREPITVVFSELNGFDYDPANRVFHFNYYGERYWFHIGRIDPDSKPETGLLLLQQIRTSKVLRIEALAEPVNGYVIVKNIILYY